MKYKYVKIAADTVTTPLTGASTEGTADASALSRIKGILTGDTEKDMFDKAISHFKEKSKASSVKYIAPGWSTVLIPVILGAISEITRSIGELFK